MGSVLRFFAEHWLDPPSLLVSIAEAKEIGVWNGPGVKERLCQRFSSQTEMGVSQRSTIHRCFDNILFLYSGVRRVMSNGSQMSWRIQTTDTTRILVYTSYTRHHGLLSKVLLLLSAAVPLDSTRLKIEGHWRCNMVQLMRWSDHLNDKSVSGGSR